MFNFVQSLPLLRYNKGSLRSLSVATTLVVLIAPTINLSIFCQTTPRVKISYVSRIKLLYVISLLSDLGLLVEVKDFDTNQ